MQDNGYRIIKLKNGESLITKILDNRRATLVLERPMQYKSVILLDQTSMTNNEMLVFKSWLDYSTDRLIEISADGILAISMPDKKLIDCYEMEKEKEDNPAAKNNMPLEDGTEKILNMMNPGMQKPNAGPPDNVNITFSVPPEMAEEIVDMMAEAKAWEELDNELEDEDLFPEVKPPKKSKKKKKPDASSNKPPQKKNKKDLKDFGNDWTDWSPDPKDYI
jgi:hypothetical protein